MTLKASCLCGSIKFELNAEPVMTAICHCTDCQHEGGSYSTDAVFPAGSLTYTAGEPTKYEHRGASGKLVTSNFCGKCGSTLVVMQEVLGGLIIVRVGSFSGEGNSGTDWFTPGAELWCQSRQKWLKDNPDMKQFQQAPE